MHLPFIRKMFLDRMSGEDISIVPLMVGELPDLTYPIYAQILLKYFMDKKSLFVISSDFCHWGERFEFQHKYKNFDEVEIYKSIGQLDKEGMQLIESHDLDGFREYLSTTGNTICGRNPISLLLSLIDAGEKEKYHT